MACPTDKQTLVQWRIGSLAPQRAEELSAHIVGCPACQRQLSELGQPTLPLASTMTPDPDATLPGSATTSPASERDLWLPPDSMVDYFRVQRPIGRGGMGEVYLARDTRLGRLVALKMIRPDALGSKKAAARFLFEAQTTARFNHPHIVTVYAVGEEEGRPYLALEYLEGQTLQQRMDQERISPGELVRIGLAIAEALQEAHRAGVFHRDLKPQNVVLAKDGRLRVLDFGLARAVRHPELELSTLDQDDRSTYESKGKNICGTPAYMAPEQWRREPASGATDIWALGMILYEMAAGRPPYREAGTIAQAMQVCSEDPVPSLPSEVPAGLAELIAGCLEKDPARRAEAGELVERLRGMLTGSEARVSSEESPFRGLLPFSEWHHHLFFGRASEVSAFVERLRMEPVLPVVGPSGAGKSSFVQAGVIPRLRERGPWLVLGLRPGNDPLHALATRIVAGESFQQGSRPSSSGSRSDPSSPRPEDLEAVARLEHEIREAPARLALHLGQLARGEPRRRVLLFVDQLEELYTLVEDEEVRRTFMQAICLAAGDPMEPVRVVFTLRDDFLGRVAEAAEAREALSRLTVLRSPGLSGLQEVLVEPLKVVGYGFDDPQLVDRMVKTVRGQPAALPLLQFAGQMLWERRDRTRRLLCRSAYEEMGGVEGALAHHAEGVLEGLSSTQVGMAQKILLRLVTPEQTRRVVQLRDLLEGLDPAAREVLERLTQSRLLLMRKARGKGRDESELELVHESLVHNWRRLSRWISESREEMAFVAEMRQAVELWERRGRREEEVWQGRALQEAQRALERCREVVPEGVRRFLETGQRLERRRVRRRRLVALASVSLLALVAVAAVIVALVVDDQRRQVQRQKRVAERRTAEAQREGARSALLRGSLLEARAKYREALETRDSTLVRALGWQLERQPLLWRKRLGGVLGRVAFAPDGRSIAVTSETSAVYLIEVKTGATRVLRGYQGFGLCFSPDSKRLAIGTMDFKLVLWDLASPRALSVREGHRGPVYSVAFSPDGKLIATGSTDHTIRLWSAQSDSAARTLLKLPRGTLAALRFSPDGRLLASGGTDDVIRLFDVQSERLIHELRGHTDTIHDLGFSADGRWLVSGSKDRTVRLWRITAEGPSIARVLSGHTGEVWGADISPDSTLIASSARDNTVRLWDRASGRTLRVLRGHTGWVDGLRFSPSGELLASASIDFTVRLWRVARSRLPGRQPGHEGTVWSSAFSSDGKSLASAGADRSIRLWDVASGDPVEVLRGHRDTVWGVSYSPDGRLLASASSDRSVRLWDARSGAAIRTLWGHNDQVHVVTFSPDGKLLASGSRDTTVRLWDVTSGELIRVLRGHYHPVLDLSFATDGRLVSTGDDRVVQVWDVTTGARLHRHRSHQAPVYGVAFCPDGKRVVSGSVDRTVRLWRPGGPEPEALRFDARVGMVACSANRIGVPLSNGTARLIDPKTGSTTTLFGHRGEVSSLRFGPDGRLAATTGYDGTVRLWEVASGRPVWRAPLLLRKEPPEIFSHRGWSSLDGARLPRRVDQRASNRRWRDAVGAGRLAAAAGHHLCIWTLNDRLELWDRQRDERLASRSTGRLRQLEALPRPRGCLTVEVGGRAIFHTREGSQTLSERVEAASIDTKGEGSILLAVSGSLVLFRTSAGRPTRTGVSIPVSPGASALARVEDWLILGYPDGSLERVPALQRGRSSSPSFSFEDMPLSPVTRLLAGPPGTVISGFTNGLLGIWSLQDGTRLHHDRLHGAVTHLLYRGGKLVAVSELGDHLSLDLGLFERDYCWLVRRAWKTIPLAWREGHLVLRAAPHRHRCRRTRGR